MKNGHKSNADDTLKFSMKSLFAVLWPGPIGSCCGLGCKHFFFFENINSALRLNEPVPKIISVEDYKVDAIY